LDLTHLRHFETINESLIELFCIFNLYGFNSPDADGTEPARI